MTERSARGTVLRCPKCGTDLGADVALQMKMTSGLVGGRSVRECPSCGAFVRLTKSWSVTRDLFSLLLLAILVGRIAAPGRSVTTAVLTIAFGIVFVAASVYAARATLLEVVPVDYGKAS